MLLPRLISSSCCCPFFPAAVSFSFRLLVVVSCDIFAALLLLFPCFFACCRDANPVVFLDFTILFEVLSSSVFAAERYFHFLLLLFWWVFLTTRSQLFFSSFHSFFHDCSQSLRRVFCQPFGHELLHVVFDVVICVVLHFTIFFRLGCDQSIYYDAFHLMYQSYLM